MKVLSLVLAWAWIAMATAWMVWTMTPKSDLGLMAIVAVPSVSVLVGGTSFAMFMTGRAPWDGR